METRNTKCGVENKVILANSALLHTTSERKIVCSNSKGSRNAVVTEA